MTSKSIFMTSKSMVASPMVPMVVMHFSFAFFRVATAFDATFVNIVIDFVSFVTNNNHRNTTEITTIGDLGIHARYIIEGIRAEQIEHKDVGIGVTETISFQIRNIVEGADWKKRDVRNIDDLEIVFVIMMNH